MSSSSVGTLSRASGSAIFSPIRRYLSGYLANKIVTLYRPNSERGIKLPDGLGDFHLPPGNEPPPRNPLQVVLALIGALVLSTPAWLPLATLTPPGRFSTAIGQRKIVRLGDGSWIMLNTDSELDIKQDHGKPHLYLNKGEVLCNLTHNPGRHLVVSVGNISIADVGTVFSVRKTDNNVRVIVKEGEVRISGAGAVDEPVAQNKRAVVAVSEAHSIIDNLSPEEVDRKLSWQFGRLTFQNERAASVVEEINRYNASTKILITDPTIANQSITIVVNPTDPTDFVTRFLGLHSEAKWDVTTSRKGISTYRLQRGSSDSE